MPRRASYARIRGDDYGAWRAATRESDMLELTAGDAGAPRTGS